MFADMNALVCRTIANRFNSVCSVWYRTSSGYFLIPDVKKTFQFATYLCGNYMHTECNFLGPMQIRFSLSCSHNDLHAIPLCNATAHNATSSFPIRTPLHCRTATVRPTSPIVIVVSSQCRFTIVMPANPVLFELNGTKKKKNTQTLA